MAGHFVIGFMLATNEDQNPVQNPDFISHHHSVSLGGANDQV